jgi:type IV pilus assembly protein PilN
MIRINLLTVDREKTKRRSSGFAMAQKVTALCGVILAATAVAIGWWYWTLQRQSTTVDEEIATAQRETSRLRRVLAQVKEFETRKAQLEQRVLLIEQLRKGQSGPVHMLDELSRSLPEMLWLTQMEQKGDELTIEGRASTLVAISDFVGNLEQSRYFKKPVEILSSQVESLPDQGDLVKFSIKAQFAPPSN